jgi:hypothetical protein
VPVVFPLWDYPLLVFLICAVSASCAVDVQLDDGFGDSDRSGSGPFMDEVMIRGDTVI